MNSHNLIIATAIAAVALSPSHSAAQTASVQVGVSVTAPGGESLKGQEVTVTHTGYNVGYGSLKLNAEGSLSFKAYPGPHLLEIERPGFEKVSETFEAADGTPVELSVQLYEKTRTPYALRAENIHNAYTGRDDLALTWNVEPPVFFDDFESYDPFSITFGEWTGIDADGEATAALAGNYPNRGVMQYCQIINPLTVTPTWWYDYPVLQPRSGKQYAGFIRTSSGNANDDWLISPAITPGEENELAFWAKAADKFSERFMVYVTTDTDDPTQEDFVRIDQGNYESVDFKEWKRFSYDLSQWAGQPIRFAIRYNNYANRYGAFMLMVDDVYVGQKQSLKRFGARRVTKSPANPNETFKVYLDGAEAGTTDGYEFLLEGVAPGTHTLGVQAFYKATQSELTEMQTEVSAGPYRKLEVAVEANSKLSPEGTEITLLEDATATGYTMNVAGGEACIPFLPEGTYTLHIDGGAYEALEQTLTLDADKRVELTLEDNVVDPYNLEAIPAEKGAMLKWNQESIFTDSFEDYPDFAKGEFGNGWKTIDNDQLPVYPISLGGTIVRFPGSGTDVNPLPVPPMVFNPWATTPAMLPTDPAIAAPTGDKSVIFFSPQRYRADKWLISPPLDVREGHWFSITAKGYAFYPESLELCISDGSDNPADFETLAAIPELTHEGWTEYSVELTGWEGQGRRLAVHYTSIDAFLAQVDDFKLGPQEEQRAAEDYGNVVKFEVYKDGSKIAETEGFSHFCPIDGTAPVRLGVKAVYKTRESAISEIEFTPSGIMPALDKGEDRKETYTLSGFKAADGHRGITIRPGKKHIAR